MTKVSSGKDVKHPLVESLPQSGRIAYVRAVRPGEIAEEADLPEGVGQLYSVHDESGRRLAVFADRDAAFAVTRTNDFTPVSVH